MTRAFISHSSKDAAFAADYLEPLLEREGLDVWCSAGGLSCGVDWERQVHRELTRSDWLLVVLSPDAIASDWVRAEVHWATEHRKGRIAPLMVRTCDPASLHLRLASIQFIDFRVDRDAAAQALLARLRDDRSTATRPDDEATLILPATDRDPRLRIVFRLSVGDTDPKDITLEIEHQCLIGRGTDVDLPIGSGSVSRHHARLRIVEDAHGPGVEIADLQSANGTFVNRKRIGDGQRLAIGDVIGLGAARLELVELR